MIHANGNELDNVSYNQKDLIAPFDNSLSLFLFKKTERIVLALYLITDHVPVEETIRHSIREQANQLLKDMMFVSGPHLHTGTQEDVVASLQAVLYTTIALLDLGVSVRLISFDNGSVVKNEILKLHKDISLHTHATPHASEIKKSFFMVDVPKQNTPDAYKGHKGHTKPKKPSSLNPEYNSGLRTRETHKKTKAPNNREEEIKTIVRSKGQVTIKDITDTLTDVGPKTIQRTLLKMVQDGVLKKEGERRWSTYTMM